MKKFKIQYLLMMLAVVTVVLLPGCADNTPAVILQQPAPHVYGFWGGLWHGMIAGPDFICSLFWDDVTVFAQSNNGHWYDFGFLWGVGGIFGGGATASSRMKRKR
jgi:hypothetical protein